MSPCNRLYFTVGRFKYISLCMYDLLFSLITLYIFQSSAYKNISDLGFSTAQSSGRSFMYNKNNKRFNVLPCVIPLHTLNHDDFSPFKTTHCFLLYRKSVIHSSKSLDVTAARITCSVFGARYYS